MGIAAGIVTFNPTKSRLIANIDAIYHQVEYVFIYDNRSSNSTDIPIWLKRYSHKISYYWSEKNSGMSVALNYLANVARRSGFSSLLLLDQDSIASEDLVNTLSKFMISNTAIVAANTVDRNTLRSDITENVTVQTKRVITSGSLLNLKAHASIGGYDERLFVDWVDFEFCDNLRNNGWAIIQTSTTSLLHECAKQEYTRLRIPRKNKQNGNWELRGFIRMNWPKSRFQDQIRSRVITIAKYRGTEIALEETFTLVFDVVKSILIEKNRIQLIKSYYKGFREAQKNLSRNALKA